MNAQTHHDIGAYVIQHLSKRYWIVPDDESKEWFVRDENHSDTGPFATAKDAEEFVKEIAE